MQKLQMSKVISKFPVASSPTPTAARSPTTASSSSTPAAARSSTPGTSSPTLAAPLPQLRRPQPTGSTQCPGSVLQQSDLPAIGCCTNLFMMLHIVVFFVSSLLLSLL
uniref:Uncharacterized protein n=1 Tax=Setaria viridis TaxID=4556 RepID=A0A4U6VCJ3_SETVI|nr:hypothetical protein SEVIR_3G229532v2 [Setaria viridis]